MFVKPQERPALCPMITPGVPEREKPDTSNVQSSVGSTQCRPIWCQMPGAPTVLCCLLYTSDAADDLLCVDLGGRRIIKKNNETIEKCCNKLRTQANSAENSS